MSRSPLWKRYVIAFAYGFWPILIARSSFDHDQNACKSSYATRYLFQAYRKTQPRWDCALCHLHFALEMLSVYDLEAVCKQVALQKWVLRKLVAQNFMRSKCSTSYFGLWHVSLLSEAWLKILSSALGAYISYQMHGMICTATAATRT